MGLGPMRRLNNQPRGEEGVGQWSMSSNSNEERRAFELMQQLNNQLTYGNKRDGSGRRQHKQAKKTQ